MLRWCIIDVNGLILAKRAMFLSLLCLFPSGLYSWDFFFYRMRLGISGMNGSIIQCDLVELLELRLL